MFRALLRLVLLAVILVGVGGFLLGWWGTGGSIDIDGPRAVGTAGETPAQRPAVDAQKAREVGAAVGERTATAANQARRAIADGSLTTKIKAKMALDDTIKALDFDVDTNGSVVTVSGTAATEAQKQRALQLARETDGVTQVVDRIRVGR